MTQKTVDAKCRAGEYRHIIVEIWMPPKHNHTERLSSPLFLFSSLNKVLVLYKPTPSTI